MATSSYETCQHCHDIGHCYNEANVSPSRLLADSLALSPFSHLASIGTSHDVPMEELRPTTVSVRMRLKFRVICLTESQTFVTRDLRVDRRLIVVKSTSIFTLTFESIPEPQPSTVYWALAATIITSQRHR